jgi:hypothetical protein
MGRTQYIATRAQGHRGGHNFPTQLYDIDYELQRRIRRKLFLMSLPIVAAYVGVEI